MSRNYMIIPKGSDIEHHGILGMHWGDKNGPPYPLSRSVSTGKRLKRKERKQQKAVEAAKQKEEEKQVTKDKILRSGRANAVASIQSDLTNQELREAVERIRLNEELAKFNAQQNLSKWEKAKKWGQRAQDVVNWTDTGIRAWNDFAKIYNAAIGDDSGKTKLPQVGGGNKDKKKNKD